MSINRSQMENSVICAKVVSLYLGPDKPTVQQVADQLGVGFQTVSAILKRDIAKDALKKEQALRYARSKLGSENPMFRKFGQLHHNYKGLVKGKDGYLFLLRPDWFTGYPSQDHVPYHQVVFCRATGLTEIPAGFHIHHINEDRTDNRLENLCLASAAGHRALHSSSRLSDELTMWEMHQFMIWKSKEIIAS